MKIGIIVFSNTGNTLKAAGELKKELIRRGHSVNINSIETDGDPQKMGKDIKFKVRPEVKGYDGLMFGGPVWGFRLNPVTERYLSDLPDLNGKKTVVFCTKDLKPAWTGGNQTVNKMKKLVEAKNGKILGSGIIVWKKKGPAADMPQKVKEMAELL